MLNIKIAPFLSRCRLHRVLVQDFAKGYKVKQFSNHALPLSSPQYISIHEVTLVCPEPENDSGAGGGKAETKMIVTWNCKM